MRPALWSGIVTLLQDLGLLCAVLSREPGDLLKPEPDLVASRKPASRLSRSCLNGVSREVSGPTAAAGPASARSALQVVMDRGGVPQEERRPGSRRRNRNGHARLAVSAKAEGSAVPQSGPVNHPRTGPMGWHPALLLSARSVCRLRQPADAGRPLVRPLGRLAHHGQVIAHSVETLT